MPERIDNVSEPGRTKVKNTHIERGLSAPEWRDLRLRDVSVFVSSVEGGFYLHIRGSNAKVGDSHD